MKFRKNIKYLFVLSALPMPALQAGPQFHDPIAIPTPHASYKMYAKQVIGDKRPELIFAVCDDASGDTNVTIYDNFVGCKFEGQQSIKASCPRSLVIDDFNKDGFNDIVGVSADGQGPLGMFVAYADKKGSFGQPQKFLTSIDWQGGLSAADMNGDGILDIAASYLPEGGSKPAFKFISGSNFQVQDTKLAYGSKSLRFNDVNRDGAVDIITTSGGKMQLLKGANNFQFTFAEEVAVALSKKYGKAIKGDFNFDGHTDIGMYYTKRNSGDDSFFWEHGLTAIMGPHLRNRRQYYAPGPVIAAKDFDGDQIGDLLTYAPMYGAFILLRGYPQGDGHGGAYRWDRQTMDPAPEPWNTVTGDFNGDGKLDFVTMASPFSQAKLWLQR